MNSSALISIGSFAVLALLWLGFGAALIFDRAILDSIWGVFRGLPLVGQVGLGVLFLPLMLGLWVWESSWPIWLRLALVVGLGAATVYAFFPKHA